MNQQQVYFPHYNNYSHISLISLILSLPSIPLHLMETGTKIGR